MKDEYNDTYEEIKKEPPEEHEYKENETIKGENEIPKEVEEYDEVEKPKIESKSNKKTESSKQTDSNKAKSISKSISSVITGTVAVVAAVCIIEPIYSADDTTVEFAETLVTDTSVSYHIILGNWSGKEYEVVLYNDFTSRSDTISEENYVGEQENLKPNMTYTLAVVNGTKTLGETTVKTMRTEDMPVTEFYGVSCECACSVDGTFQFQMSFIDENNWWTDFAATLTDEKGNVSSCVFTSDLTELQTIEVTDSDLTGTSATFTITCTSYENSSSGETITLWTSTEEI